MTWSSRRSDCCSNCVAEGLQILGHYYFKHPRIDIVAIHICSCSANYAQNIAKRFDNGVSNTFYSAVNKVK